MPKTRGGGTISANRISVGSGNGRTAEDSSENILELANRVIDRLQENSSVTVQIPSRTRGRYKNDHVDFQYARPFLKICIESN